MRCRCRARQLPPARARVPSRGGGIVQGHGFEVRLGREAGGHHGACAPRQLAGAFDHVVPAAASRGLVPAAVLGSRDKGRDRDQGGGHVKTWWQVSAPSPAPGPDWWDGSRRALFLTRKRRLSALPERLMPLAVCSTVGQSYDVAWCSCPRSCLSTRDQSVRGLPIDAVILTTATPRSDGTARPRSWQRSYSHPVGICGPIPALRKAAADPTGWMGWLMGFEPTTTGITISGVDRALARVSGESWERMPHD